jgi:hypothetical protein
MTRSFPCLAVAALLAACALAHAAPHARQKKGDGARFVELTRQLESRPLSDPDNHIRQWLMQWSTDSPGVTINICADTVPMEPKGYPHAGLLMLQGMFGNAAYQIQHPRQRHDEAALQTAAVRSALKAYAALRSQSDAPAIAAYDALAEMERAGTLEAHIAPLAAKCLADGKG